MRFIHPRPSLRLWRERFPDTIVDQQGQVIPGATVTVVNEATGDGRPTVSDDRGNFQITNLQPTSYTVRVELASFRSLERKNVILSAGERLSVGNLILEVGSVGETVTVESRGTQVNPAETQHSGLITATQIEQVQVLGRDVTSIMRLLPGVRYENTVDSLGMSFGTDVPNVGGSRRDWSNVIVDGLVANEVGASNLMAQQINLDAIAEVKILLNTYRAEYGRAGGGQVQIVTKSGGANYHGNLYYYGRHEKLNATNFFLNRQNVDKPRYRFNTYGANLGGPMPGASKKVFFFYSIEAPMVSRPGPLRNWTMPTAAELRGDFSQTLNPAGQLINIKDPLREGACAATGAPGPGRFPGNIIPAQSHQRQRPGAAENAAGWDQLRSGLHAGTVQPIDAGDRRKPQDEQHRPRRLAPLRRTTASTSRSRTGTRIRREVKSPPDRRSGDSSTRTT